MRLEGLSSLAIIGLGKNTGKTTLLNRLLRENPERTFALTSIGRDGEETDEVTGTKKPRIYIPRGTLFATASETLRAGDVTAEILAATSITTALGPVVILRALSDGFVELAGPSRTADLTLVEKKIRTFEPQALFVIDGAVSRISAAGRGLAEAAVLCTGTAVSRNLEELVRKTQTAVHLLTLPKTELPEPFPENQPALFRRAWSPVEVSTPAGGYDAVRDALAKGVHGVYFPGAVTEGLITELLPSPHFRELTLLATDGTRFLLRERLLEILAGRSIRLEVLHPIRLLAVAVNPKDPRGGSLPEETLRRRLEEVLDLPILSTKDKTRGGDLHEV